MSSTIQLESPGLIFLPDTNAHMSSRQLRTKNFISIEQRVKSTAELTMEKHENRYGHQWSSKHG